MEKLQKLQAGLKAPKNQRNSFGGYSYRSCEDILEASKPLLSELKLVLIISDTIESTYDRVYVCATSKLYDAETNTLVAESTGYAREAENRKGMDDSQITGSASSYARKYSLNGLLCIDDARDADATNTHGKDKPSPKKVASKVSSDDII